MAQRITMTQFDGKVQELGSVGAALQWARDNGYTVDTGTELPPVGASDEEPAGALDQATAVVDDAEGETDPLAGEDIDFTKINDPSTFAALYKQQQAQQAAYEKTAADRFEQAKAMLAKKYAGPSDAEKLYSLGRALLSPRSTPGFAGMIGQVAGSFEDIAKAKREAEITREEQLAALQAQYDEGRYQRATTGTKNITDLLKTYAAVNKPRLPRAVGTQVVNGKVVAVMQEPDTGAITTTEIGAAPVNLKPITGQTSGGQPVFMGPSGPVDAAGNPVREFDVKPKPVSATEQREIFETEDIINSGLGTVKTLEQAIALNPQAFEGSLSGWRKTLGQLVSSDDPQYVATEQFDNLVMSGALQSLKATFGANPTEGERKILLDLQAISTKPRTVRDEILRRALAAAKTRVARESTRLKGLKGGDYSTRGGSTVGGTRVIKYDKNGKRI